MSLATILKRDERGVAATEMALALPVLVTMIYGIFQVGLLYQANAGMQHALGEGARYATLCIKVGNECTVPADTAIKARMTSKLFGKGDGAFTVNDPGPRNGLSRSLGQLHEEDELHLLPGSDDHAQPREAGLHRRHLARPGSLNSKEGRLLGGLLTLASCGEEGGDRFLHFIRRQPLGEVAVLELHALEQLVRLPAPQ